MEKKVAGEMHPAVGAPRMPTAHPRRFLVPEEALPIGFAERVERGGYVPVAPRPASTVVLAREAAGGVEVLLLRRPSRSGFAAGAWVFPGGRVDEADQGLDIAAHVDGPDPTEWAARLQLERPAEALGYVVAALREAWEETGILIGTADEPGIIGRLREELLADELDMVRAARRAGIRFSTQDLLYIAHWVTPEPEPRRYDTRFFLARVGQDSECRLHGDELAEARWFTPSNAVHGFEAGDIALLPPTVDTLRRLAEFASLDAAWPVLRESPVREILPRMTRERGGVMIEY